MKSMTDNWKTFIALIQKQTPETILSLAIKLLTEEIEANLQSISESVRLTSAYLVNFALTFFIRMITIREKYFIFLKFLGF